MDLRKLRWIGILCTLGLILLTSYTLSAPKSVYAQQPTGSIATVTGTPTGPMASIRMGTVDGFANIRSGPSTLYSIIGVMLQGEAVPVSGKSPGGDWLYIKYPGIPGGAGWVWSLYLDVTAGEIPLAELPPAAQPIVTMTIDPTLASQFITTPLATRLPTYTPAAPLVVPTFENQNSQLFAGIPIGLIIIALLGLGMVTSLFSYFQAR